MNNIVIFLPAGHDRPTGGVKMVYEYANRLSNDGFNVSIQYIASTFDNSNNVSDYLRTFFRYFYSLFRTTFLSCSWFSLNKNIHESSIFKIPTKHQFDSIAILTSVSTAINFFKSVKSYDPIKVVYFIQDYECWDIDEKELISTYQNPCKKIVIAKWLKNKILIKSSAVSYIVPNGFNFEQFYLSIPIKNKNKFCVSFLYHHRKVKDTPTGLEALFRVKKCIPELKVLMFGTYDLCEKLPDWIRYYKNPSLEIHNEINNTASIYLGSSKEEGWGLTIGEAMMCGQAVVCTDNLGYKEMAVNEENSLISPVGDPQSLADNIIRLINDDDFRIKLAERGYRHIQKYSIEESYKKFKQIIESTSL